MEGLLELGFDKERIEMALRLADQNPNKAADFLFQHVCRFLHNKKINN